MRLRLPLLAWFAAQLLATPALAIPIVSVDTDPGMAGIQSQRSVVQGSSVTIDIVIQDVLAPDELHAFEFDLFYDPTLVLSVSLSDGGFLGAPVFEVQRDLGAPAVNYALTRLVATGVQGSGVLASITFDANSVGTTALDLRNVVLSAPFGVPLSLSLADGLLHVTPIPEPAAPLLFGVGVALTMGRLRRV